MKKILIVFSILLLSGICHGQTASKPRILYGPIKKAKLRQAPYNTWFDSIYAAYVPGAEPQAALRKMKTADLSFRIFLGTWCGDSRREVPRFLKLLDVLNVKEEQINLFTLGGSDSLYKQSPGREEEGQGIFRVPVFIVYRQGKEIGRINEFPVFSLEKDLQFILAGQPYSPNYGSFAMIRNWMTDGSLLDKNSNTRGLAFQLKSLVNGEHELNSLGRLLVKQGKNEEALRLYQVNVILYPESALLHVSLGEAYLLAGETDRAIQTLERSLELNKDPQLVKTILKQLYKAKGLAV